MKISITSAQDLPEQVTAILNKRGKWTGKQLGYIYAIQFIANAVPMLRDSIKLITQQEAIERFKYLTELQTVDFDAYGAIADISKHCLERQSAKLALTGNNLLEAMMLLSGEIVASNVDDLSRDIPAVRETLQQMKETTKSLTTHLTDVSEVKLRQVQDYVSFIAEIFHQMKLTQLFLKLIFDKFDIPFYDTFDVYVDNSEKEIIRYNGMREDVLKRLTADDTERRKIMDEIFIELDLKSLEVTADEEKKLTVGINRLKLRDVNLGTLYHIAGKAAV